MARCLLNISYIGTQFRGVQRIWGRKIFEDDSTIEGNLELAFRKSSFLLKSYICFSSRTDAGVHALNNVAHVDLVSKNKSPVDCHYVLTNLNKYFHKNRLAIIVRDARKVNLEFNARKCAKSRTYLYRLAILRRKFEDDPRFFHTNIEEWSRSWFLPYPDWDVEKFKQGAALLVGRHDFETFRRANQTGVYQENIRTLYSLDIEKSTQLSTRFTHQYDGIEHYDVIIRGKSFIHNQVRRMVGALSSVARGEISLRDIQIMLQVPSRHNWPTVCNVAPSYGLYLCDVEYDPCDLVYTESDEPIDFHETFVTEEN